MQVSWIDPEEIRTLLAQIEGPLPRPAANNFAWELNTLPVVPMQPLAPDNMIEGPGLRHPAAVTPPAPPPPSEFPITERRSGPASGDLWRIRERLRSLREQAQESGILPRGDELAPQEDTPGLSGTTALSVPPPAPEVVTPPPFTAVVDELVAEFTATLQGAPPLAPALPTAEQPPAAGEVQPPGSTEILPTPAAVFDPGDLPVPTVPPPVLGHGPLEYAGPAPDSPDYEPLFSQPASAVDSPRPAPVVEEPPVPPPSPFSISPPPVPAAEPEVEKAPFVVPAVGLSDRLSALALWATQRLGTTEVLLVDDYGDVLWGGHAQTPLVLSAMMAWHAAQRSTAESACNEPHRIDKDLAGGRALTVLPARTRYGVVSLAAIQEKPMTPGDEHAIRTALVLAVEGLEQV
jgi:hypothetical protein